MLLALGGGAAVFAVGLDPQTLETAHAGHLHGSDFGALRRDALDLFPRGSPIAAAAEGLKALGFQCAPARHPLANINAPSVQCDSAGSGYPQWSRLQVTVMARNGTVSDIAVGNGFATAIADARTPDPVRDAPEATLDGDQAAR